MRIGLAGIICSTVLAGTVLVRTVPSVAEDGFVQLGPAPSEDGVVRLGSSPPPAPAPAAAPSATPGVFRFAQDAKPGAQLIPAAPAPAPAPAGEAESRPRQATDGGPLELYSSQLFPEQSQGQPPMGEWSGSFFYGMQGDMFGPEFCEEAAPIYEAYWVGHYYQGDGIGYEDGYWTLGFFLPVYHPDPTNILYNNSRMIASFDGKLGTNVGIGYRHLFDRAIVGGAFWYDADESINENRYEQLTGTAELLTDNFDIVVNGYFPRDTDPNLASVTRGNTPAFQGNQIVFTDVVFQEAALNGGDITLGMPIPGNPWLKAYLGAYVYDPEEEDAEWGFRGRLRANITHAAAAEVRVTDDDLFGTNVVLGVDYKLNVQRLGLKTIYDNCQWYRQPCLPDRMYEEPERYNRIVVRQEEGRNVATPAINPRTGQPLRVLHVDRTSAPGGNGSFERPFDTLAATSGIPSDVILVQRDGSNPANPIPGGTQLTDFTRLLGEGQFHTFVAEDRGQFLFPGFATTGPAPFVNAPPGVNAVTLANNNVVNSLNILSSPGGAAIAGTNIRNFEIRNINNQTPPNGTTGAGSGILLTNAAGSGIIDSVRFNSTDPTSLAGISVNNTNTAPLALTINNVPTLSGSQTGLSLQADNSTITANATGIGGDGNGTGVLLNARNFGALSLNLQNSTFNNATTDGMVIGSDASTVNAFVSNTNFNNAGGDALRIGSNNSGTVNSSFNVTSFTNAGGDGLQIDSTNFSTVNVNVDTAAFDGAGGDALRINSATGSTVNGIFNNAGFANAGGDALQIDSTNASAVNLNLATGNFTNPGGDGLRILSDGGSNVSAFLSSASFDSAGGDGMRINSLNGSTVTANLATATFVNPAGDGLEIVADGGSRISTTLSNTPFDSAGGDGMRISSLNGSTVTGNLANATFTDPTGNGALLIGRGGSTIFLNHQIGNFDSAGGDGLRIDNDGVDSVINATFANTTFDDPAANGAVIITRNAGEVNLNLQGTSFDSAAIDAFRIDSAPNTTVNAFVANTSFDDAARSAIRLERVGGVAGDLNLNLSSVTGLSSGDRSIFINNAGVPGTQPLTLDFNFGNTVFTSDLPDGPMAFDALNGTFDGATTTANFFFTNTNFDLMNGLLFGTNGATINQTPPTVTEVELP